MSKIVIKGLEDKVSSLEKELARIKKAYESLVLHVNQKEFEDFKKKINGEKRKDKKDIQGGN